MVAEFKKRRDKVMELMSEIPGLKCHTPPAAFYVFPNVETYYGKTTPKGEVVRDANDMSMYLLNDAHVSLVTGNAFGEPGCIRMSFATSIEKIEQGMAKIKKALADLS